MHQLPGNHRFPMVKYELIPQQLLHEGLVEKENFFSPTIAKDYWIEKAHDKEYISKLKQLALTKSEIRKTGFPLSKELVDREYVITQGTLDCVDFAIEYGASANIAGGTHHAFRDRGEGFCLFNDVAIGSYYAIEKHQMQSILIIDLDVHQGNGTASVLKNNDKVFTFSMHVEKNYPFHKEKSNLDIPVKDGITGQEYLKKLKENLGGMFGGGSGTGGASAGGGGLKSSLVAIVLGVLVIGYGFMGVYTLDEQERGVVLRFGKVQEAVVMPGLSWYPPIVDQVIIHNTSRVRSHPHDSEMLTEDENIVKVKLTVQYVIDNVKR